MMALTLRVPALGESFTEATLGAWKQEGGGRGQRRRAAGRGGEREGDAGGAVARRRRAAKILRKAGETVAVGDAIAEMEQGRDSAARPAGPAPPTAPSRPMAAAPCGRRRRHGDAIGRERPRRAEEVAGSGRGRSDLRAGCATGRRRAATARPASGRAPAARAAVSRRAPARHPRPLGVELPMSRSERVVPMSPLRTTVARRLVEAQQTAAILTTFNEIDMTNVLALRESYRERFVKQHGIKLGFMSFFVKAAVEALKA